MPGASNFITSFGLIIGKVLAGYTLADITATHTAVRKYQEYLYNITLTFTNNGSGRYENLYYALEPYLAVQYTIYGPRNPYLCMIDKLRDGDIMLYVDGTIDFHVTGHAYRI